MNRKPSLFWVKAPRSAAHESCFVLASTARGAAIFVENEEGFDPNECIATYVEGASTELIELVRVESNELNRSATPFYVYDHILEKIGAKRYQIDGKDVYKYKGRKFSRPSEYLYLHETVKKHSKLKPKPLLFLKNVAQFIEQIESLDTGTWIFRGQASCMWPLLPSAHRNLGKDCITPNEVREFELSMLEEFRRRARFFISNPPHTIVDWLVFAQHYGIPTRLLDWTENPLVALFFSVRQPNASQSDSVIFAMKVNDEKAPLSTEEDPFSVSDIRLLRPNYLDLRMLVQASIFTVEPFRKIDEICSQRDSNLGSSQNSGNSGDSKDVGREVRFWFIEAAQKRRIYENLDRLGFSDRTMFPGLESLSGEVAAKARAAMLPPDDATASEA